MMRAYTSRFSFFPLVHVRKWSVLDISHPTVNIPPLPLKKKTRRIVRCICIVDKNAQTTGGHQVLKGSCTHNETQPFDEKKKKRTTLRSVPSRSTYEILRHTRRCTHAYTHKKKVPGRIHSNNKQYHARLFSPSAHKSSVSVGQACSLDSIHPVILQLKETLTLDVVCRDTTDWTMVSRRDQTDSAVWRLAHLASACEATPCTA